MGRIVWLEDARSRQPTLVGGKAATLSLLADDYPVPPGFCVVFEAYGEHNFRLEEALRADLTAAYAELSERCGSEDVPVAVRSSALGEDGVRASFAGQHETLLNLCGLEAVTQAVMRCVASARSLRALAYRARHGLSRYGGFTVLIQQLIPAEVSAVAFSLEPVTGAGDEVLINAHWGLGESIVSGLVTPDAFTVHKRDKYIVSRQIAIKERMRVLAQTGTRDAPVPLAQRHVPSLSDTQVVEIAECCTTLEARFGFPVDTESAYRDGKLFLLQCRPVTAL